MQVGSGAPCGVVRLERQQGNDGDIECQESRGQTRKGPECHMKELRYLDSRQKEATEAL